MPTSAERVKWMLLGKLFILPACDLPSLCISAIYFWLFLAQSPAPRTLHLANSLLLGELVRPHDDPSRRLAARSAPSINQCQCGEQLASASRERSISTCNQSPISWASIPSSWPPTTLQLPQSYSKHTPRFPFPTSIVLVPQTNPMAATTDARRTVPGRWEPRAQAEPCTDGG